MRIPHAGPLALGVLAALAGAAALLGLSLGAVSVPLADVVGALSPDGAADPLVDAIVLDLRLPRVALAAVVGAGLALAGAVLQGLFRNPLADPGLLGVGSGAGASVALFLVFVPTVAGGWLLLGVPTAAFLGGLGAVSLTVGVAAVAARGASTLLLAGIAVNALAGTLTSLAVTVADDARLRDLTFWAMGGLGGASWPVVLGALVPTALGGALALALARPLDLLLLGEGEAEALGVSVVGVQRRAAVACALTVGGAVAAAGGVGFVGLVAPHLVRMAIGPSHRWLLPASALAGAALVGAADTVARVATPPVELPLGLVTSLLGAPFFLGLLLARPRMT